MLQCRNFSLAKFCKSVIRLRNVDSKISRVTPSDAPYSLQMSLGGLEIEHTSARRSMLLDRKRDKYRYQFLNRVLITSYNSQRLVKK